MACPGNSQHWRDGRTLLKTLTGYLLLVLFVAPSGGAPVCSLGHLNTVLTCTSASLRFVPQTSYAPFVTDLVFNDNRLESLAAASLQRYTALVNLRLNANLIERVDVDAFAGLESLETLDLSDNSIANFDPDTVSGNPVLDSLSLSNNPLETFIGLVSNSLTSLYMRDCTLDDLPSLSRLPALRTLDLRDNMFVDVPDALFDVFWRLDAVYLHGNPWSCSSRIVELFEEYADVIVDADTLSCYEEDGSEASITTASSDDVDDHALEMDDVSVDLVIEPRGEATPVEGVMFEVHADVIVDDNGGDVVILTASPDDVDDYALEIDDVDYYALVKDDVSDDLLIEYRGEATPVEPVDDYETVEILLFYFSSAVLSFLIVLIIVLGVVLVVRLLNRLCASTDVEYKKSSLNEEDDLEKIMDSF